MKKFFVLFLMLFSFSAAICRMAEPQGDALLPMPTAEEMKEIQNFLDTLSPEELEELTKIGEEIIKEAEEQGRPLFAPMPAQKPAPTKPVAPQPKPLPTKETSKQKPTETVPVLGGKEKALLQAVLSGLVEAIASIRQKATSDEKLLELISPINAELNDITYYLNVINYSKHLVHLTDAEFKPLKDAIKNLSEKVEEIDNNLEVPEIELSKKLDKSAQANRKSRIEQAHILLRSFVQLIQTNIEQKHLLKDLERLIKKYEPEALKIKEEQEKKEKQAKEQPGKLPKTNTAIFPSHSFGKRGGTQQYTGSPAGRGRPGGPGYTAPGSYSPGRAPGMPSSGFTNAGNVGRGPSGTGKTSESNADQKKATDPKKAEKANQLTDIEKSRQAAMDIHSKIRAIDSNVAQRKDRFHYIVNDYLANVSDDLIDQASDETKELFDEVSYALGKVKKDITSWLGKVDKHTATAKEYKKHVDGMKDFLKSNLKETQTLYSKTKALALPTGAARADRHKVHIEQFNSRVEAIHKELDKLLAD